MTPKRTTAQAAGPRSPAPPRTASATPTSRNAAGDPAAAPASQSRAPATSPAGAPHPTRNPKRTRNGGRMTPHRRVNPPQKSTPRAEADQAAYPDTAEKPTWPLAVRVRGPSGHTPRTVITTDAVRRVRRQAHAEGEPSPNWRPDSDRASRQATAAATERTDADGRAFRGAIFRPPEAPDTWTADATYPADSPIPYTLTPQGRNPLGSTATRRTPCGTRKLVICEPASASRPGPSGQPVTYVTEISMPPPTAGSTGSTSRMKEPEPEPEAGL